MTTLNVTGLKSKAVTAKNVEPDSNGIYTHIGAMGGTEMTFLELKKRINPELLDKFNIICSRVRDENVSKDKINLLWHHDTFDDPENEHLKNEASRNRFKKMIFVSNYQQATFNIGLDVPYGSGIVMQNAISPIECNDNDKKSSLIKLIYHTTPHRGLELLIPAYEKILEVYPNIHLDVYSSFQAYGWPTRDQEYLPLFDKIKNHQNMTYHGYRPNAVVRDALKQAHIYAYPNIWPETSCISAIEAMSAGCNVVCPNFGALPETCANFANMYGFDENVNRHANLFANVLYLAIKEYWSNQNQNKLKFQKMYFDNFYSWDYRASQWNAFLTAMLD